MPRISPEAEVIARFAGVNPKPEPPEELTELQKRYWRQICKDLAPGHVRSDNEPCLIELVRHMAYAEKIAQELNSLRETKLTLTDKAGRAERAVFSKLLQSSREETRIISLISTKLRFTNQSRTDSIVAARERARTPTGRRPWEFGIVDNDEPEPQAS